MTASSAGSSFAEVWQAVLPALHHVMLAIVDPELDAEALAEATGRLREVSVALHDRAVTVREGGSALDPELVDTLFVRLARALGEEEPAAETRERPGGVRFAGHDEESVLLAAARWFAVHPDRAVAALAWDYTNGESILAVFTETG